MNKKIKKLKIKFILLCFLLGSVPLLLYFILNLLQKKSIFFGSIIVFLSSPSTFIINIINPCDPGSYSCIGHGIYEAMYINPFIYAIGGFMIYTLIKKMKNEKRRK